MNLDSIIFIGASEFGDATLKKILERDYNVSGIIGEKEDVCQMTARKERIPFFGVKEGTRKINGMLKDRLVRFVDGNEPDLIVMCVWESILPNEIINNYPVLNFHGSFLPEYRGWAPINWQIIHGKQRLGLSVSLATQDYDRGEILKQDWMDIKQNTNAGEAFDLMQPVAAEMMVGILDELSGGKRIRGIKQPQKVVYPLAPKFKDEHTKIDWTQPSQVVHDLIRGCNPMVYAHTTLHDQRILLEESRISSRKGSSYHPGSVVGFEEDSFYVACGKGKIRVLSVMNENERRYNMSRFVGKLEKMGRVVLV